MNGSDRHRPGWVRWARVVGVAVLVVALAELGVRALAPHLSEPELYADQTTAVKAAQLDRLAEDDRCATVVVTGNSMARDDLVPALLADGLDDGVTVYNSSLDAASPELLGRWLPDHVLPATDPDLVVIGLSSFDLNDEARISASARESHAAAPLTRDDLLGRLQRPLIERVALFRYRQELRDPTEVWEALDRAREGEEAERVDPDGIPGVLGPDGEGLSRRELSYEPSAATGAVLTGELLNGYSSDGEQADHLRALLADLTDRGIETALVALPVTEDYVEAHPDGAADHDRFLELVDEIGAETGTTVLDLHDWATTGDFADTHHLAGPAADRLSAELPGRLQEAGTTLPRC